MQNLKEQVTQLEIDWEVMQHTDLDEERAERIRNEQKLRELDGKEERDTREHQKETEAYEKDEANKKLWTGRNRETCKRLQEDLDEKKEKIRKRRIEHKMDKT